MAKRKRRIRKPDRTHLVRNKFAKFATIDQFNNWVSRMNLKYGCKDYSIPIYHPTNRTVICAVQEDDEIDTLTLVSKDEAIQEGYIKGVI